MHALRRRWRGLAAGLLCVLAGTSPPVAMASDPAPGPLAVADRPGWVRDTRSGCWVWSARPQPNETIAWSAGCDAAGRASGSGTLAWRWDGGARRFEGDLKDGKPHGRGIFAFSDGGRYVGEFRDGQFHGRGLLTTTDGFRYEGEYRDGKPNGQGTATFADGSRYAGEFRDGKFHGRGVLTSPDGIRYRGQFRDGTKAARKISIDLTPWLDEMRWAGTFERGVVIVFGVLVVVFAGVGFLVVRWLLFLPGDRGRLDPRRRWRIAISGALGSTFASMLLAAALTMSLSWTKFATEVFAIVVVAVAVTWFFKPMFARLHEALGMSEQHGDHGVRRAAGRLAWISLGLLLAHGALDAIVHEFAKEHLELSALFMVGWGPIATVIITYCWMLGWHPDPRRSRAARRAATAGVVFGAGLAWSWMPYVSDVGRFVVPLLGLLVMTAVPLAGGLAMDRGWRLGRSSRPSLGMMWSMLGAWVVVGAPYWLWVFGGEQNLWHAFVDLDLPIPSPTLVPLNLHELKVGTRIFLILSAPVGIVDWGLGLWFSGHFDELLAERRAEATETIEV